MAVTLFNSTPPPQGNFATKAAQGPPIYVTNATLLGYNQEILYFGSDIGFKKTIALDLACSATDISNQSGASPTAKTLFEFLNTSQDYSDLYINGTLMGAAKVTGFSVDAGDMVNEANCSVSFLIHSTYDDLTLLSSSTYYKDYADALPTNTKFPQILDSFSDSVSMSRSNNAISYSRNISISANKSLNIETLGDEVRKFVKGILAFGTFSFPDFTSFDKDIKKLADPANGFKKFITETVDNVSNTYNFQESLEAGNVQTDYSLVLTHSYSRDQAGIEAVTEDGAIIGLTSPRIDAAEAAWVKEVTLSSDRLKAFYLTARLSSDCPPLNLKSGGDLLYLTTSKTVNEFEGTIGYSVSANNDPRYKDGDGERWEYTITLDNDGVYQTSNEQGTINGKGYVKYDASTSDDRFQDYPKYQTAKTFLTDVVFASASATLNNRITRLIDATNFSVSPKLIRRTEAHSPRQGVISYSRSFSNNPKYSFNDGTNLIKKLESNATLSATIPITHSFVSIAPEDEREIIQKQSTESLSTLSTNSTALAYRIDAEGELNKLQAIGMIVNDNTIKAGIPINVLTALDGDTTYLGSASYSFSSLNDVIFSLTTAYNGGVGSC